MRVLLVDTTLYQPTTPLFRDAVVASGHTLRFVDEAPFLQRLEHSLVEKVAYRLRGKRPLSYARFNRTLRDEARAFRPDVVFIVKGTYVAPETLAAIKRETGAYLINYATDDPFNPAHASADLIGAIPKYDLYCSTKRAILGDLDRAGCLRAIHTWFAYQPELHFPESPRTPEEQERFTCDVCFIGGADRDRLPYLEAVQALSGVRLSLYGGYWQRHVRFRPHARGFAVGRDYRLALGGARIALCLVRQANRDGHVMRTFEIPACGAFMLAEETEEHRELFKSGTEASFFHTPEDLANQVRYYLTRDDARRRVAQAGHRRVIAAGHTYRTRLTQILSLVPAREAGRSRAGV